MRLHRRNPARVGVERVIERTDEFVAQPGPLELHRNVILPAAVRTVCVRHVARRLLEVSHQPAPFEHLREDVRDTFAGDVRAAELRDRIVAVFVEHTRVELVGA